MSDRPPTLCKCYSDWDVNDIPNICHNYEEDPIAGYCINCWHNAECHESKESKITIRG